MRKKSTCTGIQLVRHSENAYAFFLQEHIIQPQHKKSKRRKEKGIVIPN